MTARSRGTRAAASVIRASRPRVCTECTLHLQRRAYAVAATSLKISTPEPNIDLQHLKNTPPVTPHSNAATYKTFTGVVLSRPPLITPPLTSFEKAFFFYQKRLNERLVLPFTRYFYHKKDTPADTDWKAKAAERNWAPAKELGGYNPYSKDEGWNDELLIKDQAITEPKHIHKLLVEDSKVRVQEGKEGEEKAAEDELSGEKSLLVVPEGRRTESDRKHDVRALDRELTRTLYLVVKRTGGGWGFPAGEVVGREALHQTAERVLVQSAGVNMNTWIVGRVPIGHHVLQPFNNTEDASKSTPGQKTFFLKGRIMAGQANLKDNLFGLEDYKWLTKEELAKVLRPKYWSAVKNFLHDR